MKQILISTAIFFHLLLSYELKAQTDTMKVIPSIKLDGPRVGFTSIGKGTLADRLKTNYGANPFITQFGWQFETKYFSLASGTAGLIEGVVLIGGLEQNLFLPSGSFLIGLRDKNGLEFGFGPNISLAGAAFVIAAGITLSTDNINFPINLAVVPSSSGFRTSLLLGFNARKH